MILEKQFFDGAISVHSKILGLDEKGSKEDTNARGLLKNWTPPKRNFYWIDDLA